MISDKIQCPFCSYSGGDLKVGRVNPEIKIGYMTITCSACKNEFKIKPMWECY